MKDDTVSRAAVMESLTKEYNRRRTGDGLKLAWIEKAVNDVPAVQTCEDAVSRQQAIDALMVRDKELRNINWYDKPFAEGECKGIDYALEIVNALPSVQPTQSNAYNALKTLDCIDRQAAIDKLDPLFESLAIDKIKALPAAQPVRLKGRWIERNPQNSDKCRLIECDQCGFSHIVGFNVPYEHWIENRNFCERCGADMRGENR